MRSALQRRSWKELSRRRARSVFTVLTIAAAVTALWMFAIPQLTNRAMDEQVEEHRLDHVLLTPGQFSLTDEQVEELRALPNVDGLDVRSGFGNPIAFGNNRQDAQFVAIRDFEDQQVNVVTIQDGAAPGFGELLVDPQNSRSGRLAATTGDMLTLISPRGGSGDFKISGVGGSLRFSDNAREGAPVVYLTQETFEDLTKSANFAWLNFRVADRTGDRLAETLSAVRTTFEGMVGEVEYQTVPQIRPEGDWPGRESMENVTTVFYVLASLAALSALFMVFTTMNAVVREQTDEIGVMKAIGGRRRQIAWSYMRTAAIIGFAGTAAGLVVGVTLSNLLLQAISPSLMTITPGWGISWPLAALSVVVGVGGSMLASLPAVFRAARVPVHEALSDRGVSASFGQGWLDRTLQRSTRLPRMAQMGLRNTARRKASSLAAGLQVGIAVGIALGLLMLGTTVLHAADEWRNAIGGDIEVNDGRGTPGLKQRIESVPGVAEVEGVYWSTAGVAEQRPSMLGLEATTTLFGRDLVEGRWFTQQEAEDLARVAVVGLPLAELAGLAVGDVVPVETPNGPETLEIIGIDRNMTDDGKVIYVPIETHYDMDLRSVPNWYWVRTSDADEAFIDEVAAGIATSLSSRSYEPYLEINYIDANAARAEERLILGIVSILGIPIVLIGLVGLASTMTMAVLDRTREIGILRSIGAGAKDVRRMIRAEGLALAAFGWALALPLGFLSGWAMVWVIGRAFNASFGLVPPYWAVLPALAVTLALAVAIVHRPARRAINLSPGTALRYE